jgi:hypothetical protein
MMMVRVMQRILKNEARCLSFESSLQHFFMKLLAKPKCAYRKMSTTISLLQLFGFFSKSLFMAAQRILSFITPSQYLDPLLDAGFPSPSAQLSVRCVVEVHGGKE